MVIDWDDQIRYVKSPGNDTGRAWLALWVLVSSREQMVSLPETMFVILAGPVKRDQFS